MSTVTGQERNSATGKARSPEAGAGTVSRPIAGLNAGSTPAPTLSVGEVRWAVGSRIQPKGGGPIGTITGGNMSGNLYVEWSDRPGQTFVVFKKDVRPL